jgi:DNA primase
MNVTEALDAAGIEWKPGESDEEVWICCPFCTESGETPDERFRLGINISNGKGHCFNCEWSSGSPEFTISRLQKVLETGEMEIQQENRKHKKKHHEHVELPEGFVVFAEDYPNYWGKKAHGYVRKRGISEHQITDKKIGYSLTGDFHHRIIFPVYVHGKLKGIVGRDFTNQQSLKYRNSIGDKALYNIPSHTQKSVCLTEGVFDSLVVERGAKKLSIDSVAVLGHTLKDEQLELLDPYKTIYIWMDGDDAGVKGALSIVKKLPKDKVARIVTSKRDPSELEVKDIICKLAHAEIFTEAYQLRLQAERAFDE